MERRIAFGLRSSLQDRRREQFTALLHWDISKQFSMLMLTQQSLATFSDLFFWMLQQIRIHVYTQSYNLVYYFYCSKYFQQIFYFNSFRHESCYISLHSSYYCFIIMCHRRRQQMIQIRQQYTKIRNITQNGSFHKGHWRGNRHRSDCLATEFFLCIQCTSLSMNSLTSKVIEYLFMRVPPAGRVFSSTLGKYEVLFLAEEC